MKENSPCGFPLSLLSCKALPLFSNSRDGSWMETNKSQSEFWFLSNILYLCIHNVGINFHPTFLTCIWCTKKTMDILLNVIKISRPIIIVLNLQNMFLASTDIKLVIHDPTTSYCNNITYDFVTKFDRFTLILFLQYLWKLWVKLDWMTI